MTHRGTLAFVVPEGIDDPERVSGGNVYDRHVRDGLRRRGWDIRMSGAADASDVATALSAVDTGGIALIDGLVAAWAPDQVEAASRRSRVVVIAHMIAGAFPDAAAETIDAEQRSLRHADRVIATSAWTAAELRGRGLVPATLITVVPPGSRDSLADVDPEHGGELLCVGVVAPHKGQDLLLDALGRLADHDWTCTMAGSHTAAPEFSARAMSAAARLGGRVRMPGVVDDAAVDILYRRAGVLVAPSRAESFGMAIADARRAGLPVIATSVGGIPDAVAGGGAILVPHDDPVALAEALRGWMTDPHLRARLRAEAARARPHAPRWHDAIDRIDEILSAE